MSTIMSCLIGLFLLTFLLTSFNPSAPLTVFMACVAAVVFFLGFRELKPLNRSVIILLLVASGCLIWSGPDHFDWARAMTENAGIVTLLLTAPMLGAILHYAPYDKVLLSLASRFISTGYIFYVMTLVVAAFLCVLMNLATVPFAHQLMSPVAAKYPAAILQRALTRGFAVNLFWAPNLICVAVAMQYVHVGWQELAPAGMVFSALSFAAACIVGKYEMSSGESHKVSQMNESEAVQIEADGLDSRGYLLLLLMQVALILAALGVLTYCVKKNIYVTVAIIALIMPLVFAILGGKLHIYRRRLIDYLVNTLPAMSNEFLLFLSIGFFGYSLAQSPVIAVIQSRLASLSDYSPDAFVWMIIVTITGLAVTGIHPIITISSLAIALGKISLGVSSLQLAVTLITGYIMYLLLSPFSSMVMIMSGLSGKNVYSMGIKLNALYALVLSILVTLSIHVWRLLL